MADLYGTYDKRIKFTIDNTKIDATLTWIPITVLLTSTAGEEVFVELDADTAFNKCAFTKADESTELYADCEKYDVSGEVAIYHVSLDGWEIASGTDTDFYMYYDDDASANTSKISKSGGTAAQSVYDANFKAVYHMNDPQSLPDFYTTQYEAAVEPDSDGWTLGGTDYSSSDGDILTIDTSANDTFICNYYQSPDVNFDNGFYLKTRIAVSGGMAPDDHYDIQVYDGTQNEYIQFLIYDTKVTFYHSETTSDYTLTTTGYIVYELYIKGTTVYFYADGVLLLNGGTVSSASVSDTVGFGDFSSSVFAIGNMDYLYYALGVANDPTKIIDSTSNANHGTKKGLGEPVEAAGKVGQAQDFDGSDDYIDISSSDFAFKDEDVTIEAVTQLTDNNDVYRSFVGIGDSDGEPRLWLMKFRSGSESGKLTFQAVDGATNVYSLSILTGAELPTETAMYLAGVIDISAETIDLFYNGTSQDPEALTAFDLSDAGTDTGVMGIFHDKSSYPHNNWIDEVRISNTARVAAWLKATKESLWDSLLTYGNEETSGVVVDNAIFFGCNF